MMHSMEPIRIEWGIVLMSDHHCHMVQMNSAGLHVCNIDEARKFEQKTGYMAKIRLWDTSCPRTLGCQMRENSCRYSYEPGCMHPARSPSKAYFLKDDSLRN